MERGSVYSRDRGRVKMERAREVYQRQQTPANVYNINQVQSDNRKLCSC